MKKAIISIVLIVAVVCSLFAFVGCDDKKEQRPDHYTITFYDGNQVISTQVIDSLSELTVPTPTKSGFEFVGWYTDVELTQAFDKDSFVLESEKVSLYSKWNSTEVTYYDVCFYNGEELISKTTVANAADLVIPPVSKTGHVFDGWYLEPNFTTEFIKATYKLSSNINLYAKFITEDEYEQRQAAQQNQVLKIYNSTTEENEYYFFTGRTYSFAGMEIEVSQSGQALVSNLTTTGFKADSIGDFRITFKNTATSSEIKRTAHIVYYVTAISPDNDYTVAWTNRMQNEDAFMNDSATDVLAVGQNNYVPALTYKTTNAEVIDIRNLDLTYKLYDVNDNHAEIPTAKYTVTDAGSISFDSSLVGKRVQIVIAPTYNVNATLSAQSIVVDVNAGVNVYTNEELRAAYGNTAISMINIQRDITAAYAPQNLKFTTPEGRKAPTDDYDTAIYFRKSPSQSGDNIVVNGNYFTIHGENLELIDNRVDEDRTIDTASSGAIQNVQVGIFAYRSYVENGGNYYYYNTNNATIKNLKIIGNVTDDPDEKLLDQNGEIVKANDKPIIRNSGAINGIVVRSGTVDVENVTIDKTNIAIFVDSRIHGKTDDSFSPETDKTAADYSTETSSVINLRYARIDNCWQQAAYTWGITTMNWNHVNIGQCGGITYVAEDRPGVSEAISTFVAEDVVDRNYLTGGEVWFIYRAPAGLNVKEQISDLNNAYMYDTNQYAASAGKSARTLFASDTSIAQAVQIPILLKGVDTCSYENFQDTTSKLHSQPRMNITYNGIVISHYELDGDNVVSTVETCDLMAIATVLGKVQAGHPELITSEEQAAYEANIPYLYSENAILELGSWTNLLRAVVTTHEIPQA